MSSIPIAEASLSSRAMLCTLSISTWSARTRPIDEQLLARTMLLAQHQTELAFPALIVMAETAVAIAVGIRRSILLPQESPCGVFVPLQFCRVVSRPPGPVTFLESGDSNLVEQGHEPQNPCGVAGDSGTAPAHRRQSFPGLFLRLGVPGPIGAWRLHLCRSHRISKTYNRRS
jgi:hypothetical protein